MVNAWIRAGVPCLSDEINDPVFAFLNLLDSHEREDSQMDLWKTTNIFKQDMEKHLMSW